MDLLLRDKVVLVTGSSSGIGAAIARAFVDEGSSVALHYRTSRHEAESLASELGQGDRRVRVFGADLSVRGEPGRLVREVLDAFGQIDVLVNNAGSLIKRAPVGEMDDEYFDAVISANLYSAVACSRAVVPHMVERGSGSIINLSSVAARHGGGAGAALYAAAKAAVSTFTRGAAKELASSGVRVNAIAPGVVLTPFHDRFTSPEAMAAFVATVPLGRAAVPGEIAGAALFLASDALSAQVVGQILEVNGGMYSP